MRSFLRFTLVALPSLLVACAPFHYSDSHAAYCNELNSQIVMSGSTTNRREANFQNINQARAQHDYEACLDAKQRRS